MTYQSKTTVKERGEGLPDGNIQVIGIARWAYLAAFTETPLYVREVRLSADGQQLGSPGRWRSAQERVSA